MKDVKEENLTNKFRIKSLENWVLSQEKSIKDLDEKLSNSGKAKNNDDPSVEELRAKLLKLEEEITKFSEKK